MVPYVELPFGMPFTVQTYDVPCGGAGVTENCCVPPGSLSTDPGVTVNPLFPPPPPAGAVTVTLIAPDKVPAVPTMRPVPADTPVITLPEIEMTLGVVVV